MIFMRYIINATTTRTPGWQADCWNWAKASQPFKLHGIERQHLPFCQALSAFCHLKFKSRFRHNEPVAIFEPCY